MVGKVAQALTFADNALIVAYLKGDEYAFQVLVNRYQDRLVNYLFNLIRDYDQAVDLSQETFIRVFRHAHRYKGNYQFSTWIYRIATNLALDEMRRRKRRGFFLTQRLFGVTEQGEKEIQVSDARPSPEANLGSKERTRLLRTAIDSLPPRYRLVFVLKEVQELSLEETGTVLNLSVGTVKSRLHRAKRILRDKLSRFL
jgi:RNA polymerase sigma-70 factor (ECF subfamily)